MTIRKHRKKALSVRPLKVGQPVGAALATMGLRRAIPLLHGSQGCTAFAKVFFVRHFREPVPLQTTAMDQIATVMGADENLMQALLTLCEKHAPEVIGVVTTSLSETQGSDVARVVKAFRAQHAEYDEVKIALITAPDFTGSLESGYAEAVYAMIDNWVPAGEVPVKDLRTVNILAGSLLTAGDIEWLESLLGMFGLLPRMVPNLSKSLDGHLEAESFTPLTTGGTAVSDFARLGAACATIVLGHSLNGAAELLAQRTGVPNYRFDHLHTMSAIDELIGLLSKLSGLAVPASLAHQRSQLQDAMLDTHFLVSGSRVVVSGDPDLVNAWLQMLQAMGANVPVAVTTTDSQVFAELDSEACCVGDLEDVLDLAQEHDVQLLVGSSHASDVAMELGVPLIRAGYPIHDRFGAMQQQRIGYQGIRDTLFELANVLQEYGAHGMPAYVSRFRAMETALECSV